MIEKIIMDYLHDGLHLPVYAEMPPNPPKSFLVVERTGGGQRNRIRTATLAVQAYAPTMSAAATLNEAVKEAMDAAPDELCDVCRAALNSDYNYTDMQTKRYRYQAVYDITHY